MEDALSLCSLSKILPVAYLNGDWLAHADVRLAQHTQCAVPQYSELSVDGVRAAQKAQHRTPAWHQFVHRDVQTHIATREF